MNIINVIQPYKYLSMWVFDDEKVGLVQEPFVSGADAIIEKMVADIPNAEDGFILLFSGRANITFRSTGITWRNPLLPSK